MGIGVWQIVVILAIVLILFGAGKLPKVMGDMGKGIRSFKAGIHAKDENGDSPPKIAEGRTAETASSRDKNSASS